MPDRPEFLDADHTTIAAEVDGRRVIIDQGNPLWGDLIALSPIAWRPPEIDHWGTLRSERDRLLSLSDKYVLPDFPQPEPQRQAWLDYRQALRDLPELTADPESPVWPARPA